MTFEEEFLAKIAAALNLPADLLGQDYDAQLTEEDLAYRRLVRFYEGEMEMERIRMQSAITNAVLALYIKTDLVRELCGYDPQKLLPDHRGTAEHFAYAWQQINVSAWDSPFATPLEDIARWRDSIFPEPSRGHWYWPASDLDGVFIDFETASPTARHVDFRKLYPKREPTYEHKMAGIVAGTDFAAIERRILASIDDPRVRCIVPDMESNGGEIRGRNYQAEMYALGMATRAEFAMREKPEVVATGAGKRDMGYLKHDPSKRHKRGKRK